MSYTLFLFLAVHNKRSPIIQEEELLKAMISPQYRQIDKTYEKAFLYTESDGMDIGYCVWVIAMNIKHKS